MRPKSAYLLESPGAMPFADKAVLLVDQDCRIAWANLYFCDLVVSTVTGRWNALR